MGHSALGPRGLWPRGMVKARGNIRQARGLPWANEFACGPRRWQPSAPQYAPRRMPRLKVVVGDRRKIGPRRPKKGGQAQGCGWPPPQDRPRRHKKGGQAQGCGWPLPQDRAKTAQEGWPGSRVWLPTAAKPPKTTKERWPGSRLRLATAARSFQDGRSGWPSSWFRLATAARSPQDGPRMVARSNIVADHRRKLARA